MNTTIIKARIYEKGYNIKEVSNILNINEITITNWIHGRNIKQINKFLELLDLLDITIDEIKKD
ncbi:MAG: helix-turn-helix domain-containing protein [Clostridiaceae bacterium]